jgi:glutamate formiminotransferase
MSKEKIIECVPNFSEGREAGKIRRIIDSLSSVPDIRILDFSMDTDHNRSVVTFAGNPDAVFLGAMEACGEAIGLIDMRYHKGIHPRMGSVDVVPFVPLGNATMEDAVEVAHRFGHAFAEKNRIPVYFYGEAALHPNRCELSNIRRGGCEALEDRIGDPKYCPDAGPVEFIACSGATAVGARIPLVAFNINLDSNNLSVAKSIAASIRESSGGMKHVKAIGLRLESRGIVQVSMNLTDYRITAMPEVFGRVRYLVETIGLRILESELIGLIPRAALGGVHPDDMQIKGFTEKKILETHFSND